METKGLMIGNYVNYCHNTVKLTGITKYFYYWGGDDFTYIGSNSITPIETTESWLLSFGFTKFQGGDLDSIYWVKNNFKFAIDDRAWRVQNLDIYVKYVHQLQNLFYTITGEELIVE